MDEPRPPEPSEEGETVEVEVLDALPVPVDDPPRYGEASLQLRPPAVLGAPAVQTAAAAATGFLAGALALGLLQRFGGRRLSREVAELRGLREQLETARRRPDPFPLEPGRSYLVHVRVLSRPPQ